VNRERHRKEEPVPQIDVQRCTGCGLCVLVCPSSALAICEGKALVIDADACRYHGFCEIICPTDAIWRLFEIVMRERKKEA
jgi:formate hydrogenlyase subunit 6/NADH:ubiquinone oxidoreductase subunit I